MPKPDYEVLGKYDATDVREGDRLVVEALVNAGADLWQPREVLHYFYFSDEKAAKSIVPALRRDGFEVKDPLDVGPIEGARYPWRIIATIETVVNLETANERSRRLHALAAQYAGEYDGWEAAAKP